MRQMLGKGSIVFHFTAFFSGILMMPVSKAALPFNQHWRTDIATSGVYNNSVKNPF